MLLYSVGQVYFLPSHYCMLLPLGEFGSAHQYPSVPMALPVIEHGRDLLGTVKRFSQAEVARVTIEGRVFMCVGMGLHGTSLKRRLRSACSEGDFVLWFPSGSSLENSIVRWCCISAAEQNKCEEWALNTKSTPLVCIRATSVSHCIEMMKVPISVKM